MARIHISKSSSNPEHAPLLRKVAFLCIDILALLIILCTKIYIPQAWYDMAMDGQLWRDLYRRRWPHGHKLEAKLDHAKKTLKVTKEFHTCPPKPDSQ